mmetsp:Transcript_6635/g.11584  ORF Transcript_6635/g.11584 Transcript_6635/m.11584 type:complete len:118 (-) Transcript_6635:59-412(-)
MLLRNSPLRTCSLDALVVRFVVASSLANVFRIDGGLAINGDGDDDDDADANVAVNDAEDTVRLRPLRVLGLLEAVVGEEGAEAMMLLLPLPLRTSNISHLRFASSSFKLVFLLQSLL